MNFYYRLSMQARLSAVRQQLIVDWLLHRDERDALPRGPDMSPRRCEPCATLVEYDSAADDFDDTDWFLSDTNDSDSSPEVDNTGKTFIRSMRMKLNSRFNMDGQYHSRTRCFAPKCIPSLMLDKPITPAVYVGFHFFVPHA